ncbi:hypothetical protein PGT21_031100 [Puccinia graminis f. sp. tritici]|uniref:Uncharacterized protein n=1 Tax=Puccinia graminis f. sp. tritici TaxID=56615 RepID=A0A5B0LYX5_PUCGR|nr:hypothetical protein PGT21_031100 [Puccinia graminis f. sp. tritici]KAA1112213.1 hypothetical protein PGTUg99_014531 [Puccinia graminis f. sp. tritici]
MGGKQHLGSKKCGKFVDLPPQCSGTPAQSQVATLEHGFNTQPQVEPSLNEYNSPLKSWIDQFLSPQQSSTSDHLNSHSSYSLRLNCSAYHPQLFSLSDHLQFPSSSSSDSVSFPLFLSRSLSSFLTIPSCSLTSAMSTHPLINNSSSTPPYSTDSLS